jgi:hypothetical protein
MTMMLLRGFGRAQPVGGASQTMVQRIDSIDGGPAYHWRMNDTGSVMAARVGGVAGTLENVSDLVRGVDPITANPAGGKSIGFGGAPSSPGHGTIPIGPSGIIIREQHTIHQQVQIDRVATKYVMLATDPIVNGEISREFISDGVSGMIPRMFTRTSIGPVAWRGSNPGTVPIGSSFSVDWVQQNGVLRVFIDGVEVPLTLEAGTPPGTWTVAPTGTLYVGVWPTMTAAFNGLMSELAIWNSYVFTGSDASLLATPKNVVWARVFNAGNVPVSQTSEAISAAAHHHPEDGTTLEVVDGTGTRGTLSTDGSTLSYAAGAVAGADSAMSWRISHANGISQTVGFEITVVTGAVVTDLPFFGLYYGADAYGSKAANTHMKASSDAGVSFFFYAERAGTIDRILFQARRGENYGLGDGGTYTIEVRAANATTKLPISGGQLISRRTGWNPGPGLTVSTDWLILTFTEMPNPTVAGQPYCLIFKNTHPQPAANFFSTNINIHHGWEGGLARGTPEPSDYREPAGTNVNNLGNVPTAVAGWCPHLRPNGQPLFPYPTKAYNGDFQYNRIGPEHACLHYSPAPPGGQWVGPAGHAGGGSPDGFIIDTNGKNVRERFRVTRASRTVDGVFIRLCRLSGTGSLVVRLEVGPQVDAHNAANGTLMESVTVPQSEIYTAPSGDCELHFTCGANTTFIPYIWVPFTQNHTLVQGTIYNLRLLRSGSIVLEIIAAARPDNQGLPPIGRDVATWAQWENTRQIAWNAFEDSRGVQWSTDSGANWVYVSNEEICPITFRCVT